ncbi:Uncharacterized protein OBRU01_18780 [Operophtera brumata]|uniref:Uncharacterized protein n=1 Tax=Operophtera brumata TaxID=104452 RepID=A0A0L7KYG3_OPEBR|nr:Uncharacterized protein OBRU01_18780 [Operophtera brumata]
MSVVYASDRTTSRRRGASPATVVGPTLGGALLGLWQPSRTVAQRVIAASASVFPSSSNHRRNFINTVKKGDILISTGGKSSKGIVGHAAIMASDNWVLEMPGGTSDGLEDNNRRIACDEWWDERPTQWITVYRCPDHNIANMAANWAYNNYYNPEGGDRKTVHIRYSVIAPVIASTDPSYCSKLVIQSYYYGTGSESVIDITPGIATFAAKMLVPLPVTPGSAIVPTKIPTYFLSPYELVNQGRF